MGTRLARSLELDCVTIAGDQVNRKGAMTGGYLKERSSRIGAQREIVRLGAEVEALASQQAEIAAEVVTVDQRVTSILGELTKYIYARSITPALLTARATCGMPSSPHLPW